MLEIANLNKRYQVLVSTEMKQQIAGIIWRNWQLFIYQQEQKFESINSNNNKKFEGANEKINQAKNYLE